MIDDLIEVLERVKNCDKALDKLRQIKVNAQWKKGFRDSKIVLDIDKWHDYMYGMICECIELIEGRNGGVK